MKENVYKRIEYYLYNYKNIDNKIEEIRESIIESVSISTHSHLIGKNSVEEQAIKLADNRKIYNLKKAKAVISHYLKLFKSRNYKRYEFIKMKYLDKSSPLEIKRELGYNDKQQADITNMVVSFFYKKFKKAGIGGM
ncbi:MAG: hypothetical protein IKL68_06100 [Clostridia bacterium]|nr:hypothetical protein [Clostridia bacterium]